MVGAFRKNHNEKENGSKEAIHTAHAFLPQDGRATRKIAQVASGAPKNGGQTRKNKMRQHTA
jgi:hypothetical protein